MLAITVGLGVWQIERLAWKRELLAAIAEGEAAQPIALPPEPQPFLRYVATGVFGPAQALYGAEVRQGSSGPVMGAQVVAVLHRPGAPSIIVDRGWQETSSVTPVPTQTVTVEGYMRPPEHTSWLQAKDDPVERRFYTLDPLAIGMALGEPDVQPFTLVEIGPKDGSPQPIQALPRPPNDHLMYAVTWFLLSGALIVVFAVYVFQTARADRSRQA